MTKSYYLVNTGIGGSFGFSTIIAVLIGVVIITLTMYTSVLSRSRDFAVIRAIGGRRRDVAVVVISEALIIAGAGLFVGFLLLTTFLNAIGGSSIPNYFPALVPPILAAGTLLISLLGSLIALRVALKAEPASVFH
jgi:ABC-type antimicrobial peptide transport system permease subunit